MIQQSINQSLASVAQILGLGGIVTGQKRQTQATQAQTAAIGKQTEAYLT